MRHIESIDKKKTIAAIAYNLSKESEKEEMKE